MQRKDNKRNKLDIWAHDINVSVKPDNLIENIIENIYRYIMDFKPYSIAITRRKTEKKKNRTYYLKPTLKICVDLNRKKIGETISKWTKEIDALKKIIETDDWENKLLEHYNNQDISDDVLLFKLYGDLNRKKIGETISKWTKEIDAIKKIIETDGWENKSLEEHYNNQDISDDVLLFKLYKDQLKDDQIIIITDKYSAGYFKSLQETNWEIY